MHVWLKYWEQKRKWYVFILLKNNRWNDLGYNISFSVKKEYLLSGIISYNTHTCVISLFDIFFSPIHGKILHKIRDFCASMNIMGFPTFDMTKWIEQKGRIILSISFSCFLAFFKDHHLTVVDIHTVYAYWRPYFEYISYVCTWTQSLMFRLCSRQKFTYLKRTKILFNQ